MKMRLVPALLASIGFLGKVINTVIRMIPEGSNLSPSLSWGHSVTWLHLHFKNRLSPVCGFPFLPSCLGNFRLAPSSFQLPQKVEKLVFPVVLWGTLHFALPFTLPSEPLLEERSEIFYFPLKLSVSGFFFTEKGPVDHSVRSGMMQDVDL